MGKLLQDEIGNIMNQVCNKNDDTIEKRIGAYKGYEPIEDDRVELYQIIKRSIPDIVGDNPLYETIADKWLFEHKYQIAESTAYNYKKGLPVVKEYFSGIRIKDIDSEMIYNFVKYLKSKYIVISSTRLYCKLLQLSLRYAVRYHYINYNPAEDIKMPACTRAEVKPFSEKEMEMLLAADGPQWVKDGAMIAYRTGMRPGEIYALKWSDINLDLRFISVQRAISRANSHAIIKEPKTKSGIRRIDIDSKLIARLKEMRNQAKGIYVFPGAVYEYRVPWNVSKCLKKMCDKAGIPQHNFYSLRHTHATVLLSRGIHPKIVQERLGHSSIDITMGVYSHTTPTMQMEAVKVFEEI